MKSYILLLIILLSGCAARVVHVQDITGQDSVALPIGIEIEGSSSGNFALFSVKESKYKELLECSPFISIHFLDEHGSRILELSGISLESFRLKNDTFSLMAELKKEYDLELSVYFEQGCEAVNVGVAYEYIYSLNDGGDFKYYPSIKE